MLSTSRRTLSLSPLPFSRSPSPHSLLLVLCKIVRRHQAKSHLRCNNKCYTKSIKIISCKNCQWQRHLATSNRTFMASVAAVVVAVVIAPAFPPSSPHTHNEHLPPAVPNSLSGRCLHRCCFTFPVINIHLKNNRGACYGKITSQRGGERERGECGAWRRRGVALCEWHLANCRMRRGKLEFSKLCAR